MDRLLKILKNKVVRSWLQLGGSVLVCVAIISFCISSSINNNHVEGTNTVTTKNIATEHNDRVDELVAKNDLLIKDPSYYVETEEVTSFNGFEMTVLDVGQASCCLINADGHYMLFDGGDRETSSFVFSFMQNTEKIKKFDYVVASHYDSDHIAGLIGIIQKFPVDCILGAPYIGDTKTYESFYNSAANKGGLVYPEVGDQFYLGNALCTVISPVRNDYSDENSFSLGLRIEYENTSYIIMGDATCETELDSIATGLVNHTDVMIVNHHGSSSSSSQEFIDTVNPQMAIISVGKDNDYGHPAEEVLLRFENIPVYRTDVYGTLTLVSDGNNIEVYSEK